MLSHYIPGQWCGGEGSAPVPAVPKLLVQPFLEEIAQVLLTPPVRYPPGFKWSGALPQAGLEVAQVGLEVGGDVPVHQVEQGLGGGHPGTCRRGLVRCDANQGINGGQPGPAWQGVTVVWRCRARLPHTCGDGPEAT